MLIYYATILGVFNAYSFIVYLYRHHIKFVSTWRNVHDKCDGRHDLNLKKESAQLLWPKLSIFLELQKCNRYYTVIGIWLNYTEYPSYLKPKSRWTNMLAAILGCLLFFCSLTIHWLAAKIHSLLHIQFETSCRCLNASQRNVNSCSANIKYKKVLPTFDLPSVAVTEYMPLYF